MGICEETVRWPSANGRDTIAARDWQDRIAKPRIAVAILHGMIEHGGRYDAFARFLAARGDAVVCPDLAGHGRTAAPEHFGSFGPGAPQALVRDAQTLLQWTRRRFPGAPVVLLGHSLGSFIARAVLNPSCTEMPDALAPLLLYAADAAVSQLPEAVLLSGTAGPTAFLWLLPLLGRALTVLLGETRRCHTLAHAGMRWNNRRVRGARTHSDWLTHDRAVVAAHDADPFCAFDFTYAGLRDIAVLWRAVSTRRWASGVPRKLPVALLWGTDDPIGSFGRGPRRVAKALRAAGLRDITCLSYPHGRHEMLNEIDRDLVWRDVLRWMQTAVGAEQNDSSRYMINPIIRPVSL